MKSRDVITKIILGSGVVLLMSLIAGCDESNTEQYTPQESTISPVGDDTSSRPLTVTGKFIDAAVEGLTYSCSSNTSGVTDSNGTYTCDIGDDVTFSIGAVTIGSVAAQSEIITPYVIFPDDLDAALNLARLLQSVDEANTSEDDVITVDSEKVALLPAEVDFRDAAFTTTVETALGEPLISAIEAQEHLNSAITTVGGEVPKGTFMPVADAGEDQNIHTTDLVQLDGNASSDGDGDELSFIWEIISRPEGSNASLFDAEIVRPNFVADLDGSYVIELTVDDGTIQSPGDTVTIIATTENAIPLADARAEQFVTTGQRVRLDGLASSDADHDVLSYLWSLTKRPEGSSVSLQDATESIASFDTDKDGIYEVMLIVSDTTSASIADIVSITAMSNSGTLDTQFSSDGIVAHDSAAGGQSDDQGRDIVLDSIGNIYVTGSSTNSGGHTDMVIWKYNSSGELDIGFGVDGIVVHGDAAGGAESDVGNALVLDSAGNIYVTGHSRNIDGNSDMVIWKYRRDGTADGDFGEGGIVTHDSAAGGEGDDIGNDIVLDGAGNIYVTGHSDDAYSQRLVLWKYRRDGTLDNTFDEDGFVTHSDQFYQEIYDEGESIVLDDVGNIYVTGHYVSTGAEEAAMTVWKYRSDGSLDSSFGHEYRLGDPIDRYEWTFGEAVAFDDAGNIYVTGYGQIQQDFMYEVEMFLWKYRSDGTLDSSFNASGLVVYKSPDSATYHVGARAIALDKAGNIYVTGHSGKAMTIWSGGKDMITWKYGSDGSLDMTFDGDGVVSYLDSSRKDITDAGSAIAVDSVGAIYVSGRSNNSDDNDDMVIWKYR